MSQFIINKKEIYIDQIFFDVREIRKALIETNEYLLMIAKQFDDLNIDLIDSLGNRNISGTVGEIFKYFFVSQFKFLKMNPHEDGYPDIIFVDNENKQNMYMQSFENIDGKKMPLKSKFSPFEGGGIEIKCTMGLTKSTKSIDSNKRNLSRIDKLSNLSYSAHHRHEINLLALYFDFYYKRDYKPQILSIFFSKIAVSDWADMSLGSAKSKTTSATRIKSDVIKKIKNNCLIAINDDKYIKKFRDIGVLI